MKRKDKLAVCHSSKKTGGSDNVDDPFQILNDHSKQIDDLYQRLGILPAEGACHGIHPMDHAKAHFLQAVEKEVRQKEK